MKSALILVISSFFLIGVFGETVTVTVTVSVMERDSVTLHTDLTEIQRTDSIEWKLNGVRIAKISMDSSGVMSDWVSPDVASRDRLQLNRQTGDLKIKTTDSGKYLLKFRSTRWSSDTIFNVNGADKVPVKMVSGTVGESVTLKLEKKSDELIQWRFGPQNTVIAELLADSSTVYPDGSFRDRLELDVDTGSLTITNIAITDSEDYEAGIRSRGSRYTIHKTFSVSVTDVKSMPVNEGGSVSLYTGLARIQTNDVILWRFGAQDDTIARLNGPVVDLRWSNVNLNDQTGDLTISNIRRDQSGDYKVEFNTTNMISYRKYHIIVSDEQKSVSVMERDSVTLNSGLTEIQRDDEIRWSFKNNSIAEIIKAERSTSNDGRFRGRLKLDEKTGSLTITNIRITDDGEYEVEIRTNRFTVHKRISVTVETVISVLVMEGDSVTLHTGASEIPRDDAVLWYGDKGVRITPLRGSVDARWKNTAQNDRTGDLTIRNIRRDQSGDYKVFFMNIVNINNGVSKLRKFHINITDADKDQVKTVFGTVGESVTLKPEKKSDELIQWRFGPQNTLIAELLDDSSTVYPDERFRDRLKLDVDTGSLTITDIRNTHSGDYEAGIRSRGSSYTIHKTFSVSVTEIVKLVLVKEGDSVTLHTDASISRDDAVLWFGDEGVRITPLTGPVDPRWKNTVQNDRTGDLTIKNIRRDQSGDYKVIFMNINGVSKHKKFHINITDLSPAAPDSGLSSAAIVGIVVVLLVFAAAATAGVIYSRHKRSKPGRTREVNGQNHTSDKDEETELTKPAETVAVL